MKSFGRRTSIDQYDLEMNFLKTWRSIREAADSLGYTSQSISNNLRLKTKSAYGYRWLYNKGVDLEDEFWLEYPLDPRFQVSNRGRVKTPTGKITMGYNIGVYRRIRTSNVSISVHRMVALTFIEPVQGANIVNHIDHNPQNNWLENLEWVTHKENMRAAERFYNK
jgi:hypothetical protein